MTPQEMTPLDLANATAQKMWEGDAATHHLNMQITHIGVGEATLTMPVQDFMLNGHKTAHGGYIFTLADSAFAFACNTYNQRTVAQSCHITFTSAGMLGDILTATAIEQSKQGRSGVYDATVTNQKGETIALFRGLSRTVKGVHLEQKP